MMKMAARSRPILGLRSPQLAGEERIVMGGDHPDLPAQFAQHVLGGAFARLLTPAGRCQPLGIAQAGRG